MVGDPSIQMKSQESTIKSRASSFLIAALVVLAILFIIPTSTSASPVAIWPYVQKEATEAGLDPHFVYAIAFAESTLDPFADSGRARGVMQLKEIAWKTVTDIPYAYAWDWQTNIKVGIAYLNYCKNILLKNNRFSYPILAASYRYGPTYMKKIGYNMSKVKKSTNKVYKQILSGKRGYIEGVVYPTFVTANYYRPNPGISYR